MSSVAIQDDASSGNPRSSSPSSAVDIFNLCMVFAILVHLLTILCDDRSISVRARIGMPAKSAPPCTSPQAGIRMLSNSPMQVSSSPALYPTIRTASADRGAQKSPLGENADGPHDARGAVQTDVRIRLVA